MITLKYLPPLSTVEQKGYFSTKGYHINGALYGPPPYSVQNGLQKRLQRLDKVYIKTTLRFLIPPGMRNECGMFTQNIPGGFQVDSG